MLDRAPTNIPQKEKDKFVPFKDLHTHEEFGKHSFNEGEPYAALNQGELFQSGANKDYIIKALAGKRFEVMRDIETPSQVLEYATDLKRRYSELETVFGIHPAPTTLVSGKSITGFPELYSITEKVDGLSLNKITPQELKKLPENFISEIGAHFENLLRYLEEKFPARKRFMADIFINEQYVYGKTKNDPQEKLYLIDTEPQYLEIENIDETELWSQHLTYLHNLLCIMYELEEQWQLPKGSFNKIKFAEAYKKLIASAPKGTDTPYDQSMKKETEELLLM